MFSHIKELFTRPSGYQISRSVRLRSSASAYFNRTPASAGNRQKWTWNAWVKRSNVGTRGFLFSAGTNSGTAIDGIEFNTDSLRAFSYNGSFVFDVGTNGLFRDPSAWYMITIAFDSTQATSADRIKLYVNAVQQTFSSATYPSLNATSNFINNSSAHYIGNGILTNYFDGYLTEVNFIDGQALTPSSFGETDTLTGVWKPKKYAGTYGTNGFYLNFSDNSSNTATTIGKDYSGNGNNWTPNNISVTSGVTYDSMLDVPTLYADGGNGRGNYPVLNPLNADTSGLGTSLTYGNLRATGTTYAATAYSCTFQMPQSGKWYYEVVYSALTSQAYVGIRSYSTGSTDVQYGSSGQKSVAGSSTAYGASWTTGDVIGVSVDRDAGTVTFYKNNASQGAISIPTNSAAFDMAFNSAAPYGSASFDVNFGQRPFSYTPPTGFVALNTQNLPAPTISNGAQYMNASLWTGDASTPRAVVSNLAFSPDLVWTKDRSVGYQHSLQDTVRGTGASKKLYSSLTEAENGANSVYGHINSFDANGFTVATGSSGAQHVNASGVTYVGWSWKAGGTAVSNTSGSITSTVSAGATQGFSVVTYTGTGANATVGHGLGVAPKMVIVKCRSAAITAPSWPVWHTAIAGTQYLDLQATIAASTAASIWNSTVPTSSVFSLGTSTSGNQNTSTYVAYCFAEVAGYSKFGSYTGNNTSDGPFIYCGFRPRWIMVKSISTGGTATYGWAIFDTSRENYNINRSMLVANVSDAENTTIDADFDILSNGFKPRYSPNYTNGANTYIFAAFAEVPFKYSLAR